MQQVGLAESIRFVVMHPGSLGGLNRMIHLSAKSRAGLPVEQLVADIRAMVGSRRHNFGVTSLETLTDILVHGQDMAIPLRRELTMPPEPTAAAATRVWSYGGKGMAKVFADVPVRGFRLTATDVPWSVGHGPEIHGTISTILLLLTGRLTALSRLDGGGAEERRKRLAAV